MPKNYTRSSVSNKRDIETRDDLLQLMQLFYRKLLADPGISYLFTDVAKINLEEHLPVLVDFWDGILFGSDTYRKNAMQPHLGLHAASPLTVEHFETWLRYFKGSVDELFEGEKAFLTKERATGIATVMRIKISQLSQ
ncbi:MAG: group III truncated hemoglobin [Chitinophagaceae bacterium]|nr:group III truncated hemoglobin [Chitinophagaceae bacterium]